MDKYYLFLHKNAIRNLHKSYAIFPVVLHIFEDSAYILLYMRINIRIHAKIYRQTPACRYAVCYDYRMKFVRWRGSTAGGFTPAFFPASMHERSHAMLRPSARMV